MHSSFSPAEHANFVAAKVVALATAFIDGRKDLADLGRNAVSVKIEILACVYDGREARAILGPALLLANTMILTSTSAGGLDGWQKVIQSLVEKVREESHELRRSGAQRS